MSQGLLNKVGWTDFCKVVKQGKLKEMQSSEVQFNGESLFIYVNPKTDYIELQVENMGALSNSTGSIYTAEELLSGELVDASL